MRRHAALLVVLFAAPLSASELSSGLTLLRTYSARAAALGGAFTAVRDDVGVIAFNPAGLVTLKSGQASLAYERGVAEDTFSQVQAGFPLGRTALGVSVGMFDGGEIEYFDENFRLKTVTAQRDLVASLALARGWGGFSAGVSAKYLSSELVEQISARAFTADVGVGAAVGPRVQLGASLLNAVGSLRYIERARPLPRTLRGGAAIRLPFRLSTTLLLDGLYLLNERETRQAAGLEVDLGPIYLRGGYRTGSEFEDISLGSGLAFGRASLDYSFGMVQELESRHQVTFSYRFASANKEPAYASRP